VLRAAWDQVVANDGAPGVDGITIEDVVNSPGSVEGFLKKLHEDLKEKRYKPEAVRRVYILKENGKLRPLGIPTIRDRVAQTAAKLVLEPIYEADFQECSFGFRPQHSAHQALEVIKKNLQAGFREVYDADLQSYFDTIPQDLMMSRLKERIADGQVLKLIRMWLETPVVEEGRGPNGKDKVSRSDKGTPQGGVISPLLANVYLNFFDKRFHCSDGPAIWANARLVRYADDFVILARHVRTRIKEFVESEMDWLELKINPLKTRVVKVTEEDGSLDFLGYTFRYDRDLYGRPKRYLAMMPSEKALNRERQKLHEMMDARQCFKPIDTLIKEINRHLSGWSNYFGKGYPRQAFRKINRFVQESLMRHLARRSQRPFRPPKGVTWSQYFKKLGLREL
jgi:RNA-directed DNA polymerase